MAKLSFPSAFNRSLCKFYQLTTSSFLRISKCKPEENNRKKIPASKTNKINKPHKQPPHGNTFTFMLKVFLYKINSIPLHASMI